ncbi:cistern family PEP-CTERM protein [Leptolyngbya sp. KIOST-1]|uniref:cistern family PEP-CTERM protein n=1 Tax=Leptolyngbya sp. KIOST-1 TaxID=1229172 RepID=UPI00068C575C|nr:cistern family PEP-CTERM protein [Leptolyngbya sp. KIOST-1]
MKAQLSKGAAVVSAAAAVSLLQALPASAYTINDAAKSITFTLGDPLPEVFTVEFDGFVERTLITGLTSKANVELKSFDGTQAVFDFQLFNTTSAPLGSRVSVLGFNAGPNVTATVTGDFNTVGSGNVPTLGEREICLKAGGGPSCAGGGGAGPSAGQNITFQTILTFASAQDSFTLDNFFVRYQDITGVPAGTSGVGVGTPIPTPALLPGLVGLGIAALRKRGEAAEDQEAA